MGGSFEFSEEAYEIGPKRGKPISLGKCYPHPTFF